MQRIPKLLLVAGVLSAVCWTARIEVAATERGAVSAPASSSMADPSTPAWLRSDSSGFLALASCSAKCEGGGRISCDEGTFCAAVDYSHCLSTGGPDGPENRTCSEASIGF